MIQERHSSDERGMRDIEQDIAKYVKFPGIIRNHYQKRDYPEADEPFVIRWLRRADDRDQWTESTLQVVTGIFGLGLLGAALSLLYQIGLWLYYGRWYEYDMLWLFSKLGYQPEWLRDPEAWVGLSQIVTWWLDVHIGVQLILISGVLAAMLGLLSNALMGVCKPLPDPRHRRSR